MRATNTLALVVSFNDLCFMLQRQKRTEMWTNCLHLDSYLPPPMTRWGLFLIAQNGNLHCLYQRTQHRSMYVSGMWKVSQHRVATCCRDVDFVFLYYLTSEDLHPTQLFTLSAKNDSANLHEWCNAYRFWQLQSTKCAWWWISSRHNLWKEAGSRHTK